MDDANAHREGWTTRVQEFEYGELESHLYPRCEYKTRFCGTSIFEMSEPSYWHTYFRSKSDRIWCLKKQIKYKFFSNGFFRKDKTDRKKPWKTGCCIHPFEIYEQWKNETVYELNYDYSPNDLKLYDVLLNYKCSMCKLVVDKFNEKFKENLGKEELNIDVYHENDYPCVMVQVRKLNKLMSDSSKCYMIIGAYLTAIACYKAFESEIPIELVNRSSFGHNIPSVADTATSLRINIGIIPKVYAEEVLVESLLTLDKLLPDLLQEKIYRCDFLVPLNKIRKNIAVYNRNIDSYNEKKFSERKKKTKRKVFYHYDTVFDLFNSRRVAFHIAIRKSNIDLLTDKILLHMMNNGEADFHIPLKETLEQLYGNTNVYPKNISYKKEKYVFKETNPRIEEDDSFWKIVKNIRTVLEQKNAESSLSKAVEDKELLGLYSKLEEANLDFMLSYKVQSEDECNSYLKIIYDLKAVQEMTLYSREIIVSTGMRAIYVAHRAAVYLCRKKAYDAKIKTDITYMYFETAEALKGICNHVNKQLKRGFEKTVIYIDLNHCTASGLNTKAVIRHLDELHEEMKSEFDQNKKKQEVIVFDCTSATTERIRRAIKLFAPYVEVLLTVNSGLKNEQIGADMNPYGTIGIISHDENNITEISSLYSWLTDKLGEKEKLPQKSHDVRKLYKTVEAIKSSNNLYGTLGWEFSEVQVHKK